MVNCDPGASHFIAQYFEDCVYNSKELWGFALGLSSIACWSVSQLPQLIKNYKTQSSDALSPWFIAEWLVGDTLNLIGCLLRGDQLATQVWTSEYFILMDSVMLLQYLYYTTLQRRRERAYALATRYRPPGPHYHHRHHHHERKRRRRGHHHQGEEEEEEEEGRNEEPEVSTENIHSKNSNDNNDETSSLEPAGNSSTTNTGTNRTGKALLASSGSGSALMMGLILTTLMIGLATRGKYNTMIGSSSDSGKDEKSQASSQLLLNTTTATTATQHHHHYDLSQLGTTFGYFSSAFYLGARVSQLYKNFKRQSAAGLALSMFLCAILANFLYGLSIILRAEDFGDVVISVPWLLGSLGTMFFDIAILMQSLYYSSRGCGGGEKERRSDEEEPFLLDGGGDYDRRHHHHHRHHITTTTTTNNNGDEVIDVL